LLCSTWRLRLRRADGPTPPPPKKMIAPALSHCQNRPPTLLLGHPSGLLRRDLPLEGYVEVDGKVFGLTNHHVPFPARSEPFPTEHESSTKASYQFWQPSEVDIGKRIKDLKNERRIFEEEKEGMQDQNRYAAQIFVVDSEFGKVWQSSGVRTRGVDKAELNFGLDWALIELENPGRFTTGEAAFVNKVRIYHSYSCMILIIM
jgi:hypothetical protein